MQDLLTHIQTHGTPFGSRVWGGATKLSDYDYVLSPKLIGHVPHKATRVDTSQYYEVQCQWEFYEDGRKYQITVPHSDMYLSYLRTIDYMNELSKLAPDVMLHRQNRYALFGYLIRRLDGLTTITSTSDPRHPLHQLVQHHFPELSL